MYYVFVDFVPLCLNQEMHIQLSSATYEHLKGSHFIFERRGTITIKVRGQMYKLQPS